MPTLYRDFAVRITEATLEMIAKKNSGVKPEVQSGGSYFITSEDPKKMNLILSPSNFRRNFRFVYQERETAWNQVSETSTPI